MTLSATLDLAAVVVAVLSFLVVAEGLSSATRARRRAKESAEVAAALPDGPDRDTALAIASQEVQVWRRQNLTPGERKTAQRWVSRVVFVLGLLLLAVVVLSDSWLGPQVWQLAAAVLALLAFAWLRFQDWLHYRALPSDDAVGSP